MSIEERYALLLRSRADERRQAFWFHFLHAPIWERVGRGYAPEPLVHHV